MNFNLIDLMQKYSQFTSLLKQSNKDPMVLLDAELKKRNISRQQLQDLIRQAKSMETFFSGRR